MAQVQRRSKKKSPGLVLLGEHYHGSAAEVSRVQRAGHFSHIFDFPLAFALRDSYCQGKAPGQIGATLFDDRQHLDANKLVTFLDNHDLPRIRSLCGGKVGPVKEALTAQFSLRGIPALTYGTESGLEGKDENASRGDMVFPKSNNALYQHVRNLLRLRREHPVLVWGRTKIIFYADRVLGVLRSTNSESALLMINGQNQAVEYKLPKEITGRNPTDALTGRSVGRTVQLVAGQSRLIFFRGKIPVADAPRRTRTVSLRLKFPRKQPGASLLWIGSGTELGDWQPKNAKRLTTQDDGSYSVTATLPENGLFAFKLASMDAAGKVRWENGDNRYLFVEQANVPLSRQLTWRD